MLKYRFFLLISGVCHGEYPKNNSYHFSITIGPTQYTYFKTGKEHLDDLSYYFRTGDDCSYYFRTVALDPAEHTDEWRTMDRMCKIFTSFARFGNPNNESIASIQWKPMKLNGMDPNEYNFKCLNISNKVSYSDWDGINRMQLWDEIFEHLSHNGQKM